jgi:outer membrane protein assembly factor BamB
VVALDLTSGKTRWSRRFGGPILGGVLVGRHLVFVGTGRPEGRLHALDVASGTERWTVRVGSVEAPTSLVRNTLLVLAARNQLLALDPATGKIRWRRALSSQSLGAIPVGDTAAIVIGFDSLTRVRLSDGKTMEQRAAPGTIVAPPAWVGEALVAGTGDSLLVAVDPTTLDTLWTRRLDAPILSSPVARGDTIFVVTRIGSIYRAGPGRDVPVVPLTSGAWPATGAPSLLDSWLLVGGSDGRLHAFDIHSGAEQWSAALGRPVELAPVSLENGEFLAPGGQGDLRRISP